MGKRKRVKKELKPWEIEVEESFKKWGIWGRLYLILLLVTCPLWIPVLGTYYLIREQKLIECLHDLLRGAFLKWR